MIKVIWAAQRKPGMTDETFYRHWYEVHGALGARVSLLRRYVQHHTLAEARAGDRGPTHDGASIGWFDDLESMRQCLASSEWQPLREDAPNLFDMSQRMSVVVARERVVLDGPTTPDMVKTVAIASRHPDLPLEEFQRRWFEDHGPLGARLPGLRRYVQNHALPEAYEGVPSMTHDGWAEMWFDDLEAMRRSRASDASRALAEDGRTLFAPQMSVVIARERLVKG
jgi:uncharacterized protein (TIGR02118 family)